MSRYDTPEKRAAHAERQKKWREKNAERWAEIARPSRKKWKESNRDAHRECQREHRYTVRQEILALLGDGKCKRCGYDDWRALEIDHINSDGKGDRATLGGTANMWAFRNKIKKDGGLQTARLRYQVLCCNCNQVKRFIKKEFGMSSGI